eukprot:gene19658-26344_t
MSGMTYTIVKPIRQRLGDGVYDTRATEATFAKLLNVAKAKYKAPKVKVNKVARTYTSTIVIDEKHNPKCTQVSCCGHQEADGLKLINIAESRLHNGVYVTYQEYQFIGVVEHAEFNMGQGKTLVFELEHDKNSVTTRSLFPNSKRDLDELVHSFVAYIGGESDDGVLDTLEKIQNKTGLKFVLHNKLYIKYSNSPIIVVTETGEVRVVLPRTAEYAKIVTGSSSPQLRTPRPFVIEDIRSPTNALEIESDDVHIHADVMEINLSELVPSDLIEHVTHKNVDAILATMFSHENGGRVNIRPFAHMLFDINSSAHDNTYYEDLIEGNIGNLPFAISTVSEIKEEGTASYVSQWVQMYDNEKNSTYIDKERFAYWLTCPFVDKGYETGVKIYPNTNNDVWVRSVGKFVRALAKDNGVYRGDKLYVDGMVTREGSPTFAYDTAAYIKSTQQLLPGDIVTVAYNTGANASLVGKVSYVDDTKVVVALDKPFATLDGAMLAEVSIPKQCYAGYIVFPASATPFTKYQLFLQPCDKLLDRNNMQMAVDLIMPSQYETCVFSAASSQASMIPNTHALLETIDKRFKFQYSQDVFEWMHQLITRYKSYTNLAPPYIGAEAPATQALHNAFFNGETSRWKHFTPSAPTKMELRDQLAEVVANTMEVDMYVSGSHPLLHTLDAVWGSESACANVLFGRKRKYTGDISSNKDYMLVDEPNSLNEVMSANDDEIDDPMIDQFVRECYGPTNPDCPRIVEIVRVMLDFFVDRVLKRRMFDLLKDRKPTAMVTKPSYFWLSNDLYNLMYFYYNNNDALISNILKTYFAAYLPACVKSLIKMREFSIMSSEPMSIEQQLRLVNEIYMKTFNKTKSDTKRLNAMVETVMKFNKMIHGLVTKEYAAVKNMVAFDDVRYAIDKWMNYRPSRNIVNTNNPISKYVAYVHKLLADWPLLRLNYAKAPYLFNMVSTSNLSETTAYHDIVVNTDVAIYYMTRDKPTKDIEKVYVLQEKSAPSTPQRKIGQPKVFGVERAAKKVDRSDDELLGDFMTSNQQLFANKMFKNKRELEYNGVEHMFKSVQIKQSIKDSIINCPAVRAKQIMMSQVKHLLKSRLNALDLVQTMAPEMAVLVLTYAMLQAS